MTTQAWITVSTIVLVIAALLTNRIGADIALLGGLTLLMLLGVIDATAAIAGFAHPAVIIIGSLFVVAAGLQETGGMQAIASRFLGRPKTIAGAQLKLMGPIALMSAFMNNTAVVALYLPIVSDWARKLRISPSQLFMPLSFAAILGGTCTLIATASNIAINRLYTQSLADLGASAPPPGGLIPAESFWAVTVVGLPVTIAGIGFIVLVSRWLLPQRLPAVADTPDTRKYKAEMVVQPGSPIVGKTIEEAGLRHLPGLFLTEIERRGNVLPAVSPDQRLEADDRLAFAGILESVVDLRKIRGLVPATDQVEKVSAGARQRTLVEAVVSRNSPLAGRTVRESKFRTIYNAAIIAVHRNAERINAKIGDIVLQPGDTLLLETHTGFVDAYRNRDDFYLVSNVEGSRPIRHDRAWVALGILGLLVVLLVSQLVDPVVAVLFCAMAMIGTRCVTGTVARSSVRWDVLIVIASALGIGRALTETGAAGRLAEGIVSLGSGLGPQAMLLVIFALTSVAAQLITNNGAAVLMFPIAMETARNLGVSPEPFVITLMVAAGCNLMTPIAYQTNLMVYGPGGYRFLDYPRLGVPLTVIVAVLATLITPVVFPFGLSAP